MRPFPRPIRAPGERPRDGLLDPSERRVPFRGADHVEGHDHAPEVVAREALSTEEVGPPDEAPQLVGTRLPRGRTRVQTLPDREHRVGGHLRHLFEIALQRREVRGGRGRVRIRSPGDENHQRLLGKDALELPGGRDIGVPCDHHALERVVPGDAEREAQSAREQESVETDDPPASAEEAPEQRLEARARGWCHHRPASYPAGARHA